MSAPDEKFAVDIFQCKKHGRHGLTINNGQIDEHHCSSAWKWVGAVECWRSMIELRMPPPRPQRKKARR